MSALLTACCCEIDGECCNATWGAAQSQDLSLNFSTPWTDSYHQVRWESCTAFGVTNYPRTHLYTRRSRVTFTDVVMRKRTGLSETDQKWVFYSGTVSLEHVSYAATFGREPAPPSAACVPNTSGSFDCENTMTITASVVASGGTYTTSSSGTCSSNASAALSWGSEPTDWDDDWLYIAQDCLDVDFSACGDNGTVLDFTNWQFRLFGPSWPAWSSASGQCPGCFLNHPSPVTQSEYFALNPDCSANDMEDITWYGYSNSPLPYCGSNSCGTSGCTSCGYFRSDVYDTSLPSSLGTGQRTCYSFGKERPTMTLS